MALLEVRQLDKVFPVSGSKQVLHALSDVSFDLPQRSTVGLVGESGSGKSTLGRTVLRLLQPDRGSVSFDGVDITGMAQRQLRPLRRRMQMIFQDPYASLNPRLTVGAILAEPLQIHRIGNHRNERSERVAVMLGQVGLAADSMTRYPHQFSGGQRQRIAIARALIVQPELVVADEPVSALDMSVQAQVLELLRKLQRDFHLALLFISHDLHAVGSLCETVTVLYLGRVMEIAPSSVLFNQPKHPYTEALLSAVPSGRADRQPTILRGELPSPIDPPSGCVFRTRCPYAIPECAQSVPPLREVAPGHFKACIRDVL